MSVLTTVGVALWLLLGLASIGSWWPTPVRWVAASRRRLVATVAVVLVGTGVVALLGALGRGTSGPFAWLTVAAGVAAAAASGSVLTRGILALANESSGRASRVRATVLRGGAWIGVLERLALFGTLLAGFPMGVVAIVAVKAFARYPELKTAQATGAIERFIIGTFASLGWAALCVGVVEVLLRGAS
jgi:polyferredoxin